MKTKRTAQPKVVKERDRRRDVNHSEQRQRTALPDAVRNHPEYNFRWVNDKGLKISEALANDYDFASSDGEEVPARSSRRHKIHVGTVESGEPLQAYLMRKRKDWYEKDRAEGQAVIDEHMKQMQSEAENPSDPR